MYDDPERASSFSNVAYEGFAENNDLRRQLMTAAHAVDCHYFEWADFAPLDRWIDVFEKHLERGGAAQHRVRPAARLLGAPDRAPVPPAAAPAHRRCRERSGTPDRRRSVLTVPMNFRLNAASILFNYYNWKTKGDTADALIARVTPWLSEPQANALNRSPGACTSRSTSRSSAATRVEANDGRGRGDRARSRHQVDAVRDLLRRSDAARLLARRRRRDGRVAEASRRAESRRGAWTSPTSAFRNRTSWRCRAACAKRRKRPATRSTPAAPPDCPRCRFRIFWCAMRITYLDLDEVGPALALYDEADRAGDRRRPSQLRIAARLRACVRRAAQRRRERRGRRCCARSCSTLRASTATTAFLRQAPRLLAPLFALALAHGIERDFVRTLIAQRQLAAAGAGNRRLAVADRLARVRRVRRSAAKACRSCRRARRRKSRSSS